MPECICLNRSSLVDRSHVHEWDDLTRTTAHDIQYEIQRLWPWLAPVRRLWLKPATADSLIFWWTVSSPSRRCTEATACTRVSLLTSHIKAPFLPVTQRELLVLLTILLELNEVSLLEHCLLIVHFSEGTRGLFPVLLLRLHGLVKVDRFGGHIFVLRHLIVAHVGSVSIPGPRVLTKVFCRQRVRLGLLPNTLSSVCLALISSRCLHLLPSMNI